MVYQITVAYVDNNILAELCKIKFVPFTVS